MSLALVLALLSPTTHAAPAPSGVTLNGSRPHYIRISLPEGARLANSFVAQEGGFRVTGRGDFVGFALIQDSPRPHHAFLGGRLPESSGKQTFLFELGGFADSISAKTIQIPKGTYRFYVLPDQGRASVTLPIKQPVRVIDKDPRPARHKAIPLSPYASFPTSNVHSAGAAQKLSGAGLLFNAVWFTNDAHVASNHDACFWRNAPREPDAALPECGSTPMTDPGNLWASQGTIDYGSSTGADMRLYYGSWMPSEGGFKKRRFGQSYSIQTASAVDQLDSLGICCSLTPKPYQREKASGSAGGASH